MGEGTHAPSLTKRRTGPVLPTQGQSPPSCLLGLATRSEGLVLSLRSPGRPLDFTDTPGFWHSRLLLQHPTLTPQYQLLACLLHMLRISPFLPLPCPPRPKTHRTATWDQHKGPPQGTTAWVRHTGLPPWDHHQTVSASPGPLHPAPGLCLPHQGVFCTAAVKTLATSAQNPSCASAQEAMPESSPRTGAGDDLMCILRVALSLQQHPPE